MKHADKLIDRILFLEGVPEIARYDVIRAGTNVKEQFEYDHQRRDQRCEGLQRNGQPVHSVEGQRYAQTRSRNLEDSEEHVDWLETQLGLIEQLGGANGGLERYLAEHMFGDEDEGE